MDNDIRRWITLCEQQLEFPFLKDLDNSTSGNALPDHPAEDDIDYENEWYDILQWPNQDSSVSEADQRRHALHASEATPVTLPNGEKLYVTDEYVIEVADDFSDSSIEKKMNWLYNVDPDKYYPNIEQEWNDQFWKYPEVLYHATVEKNVQDIMRHGLEPRNQTRGLSNRSVGGAVFTTLNYEEALQGHYGDYVIEIDMPAMTNLPNRPFVSREPPLVEGELRAALAHLLGEEEFYDENSSSDGLSADTVIVYGHVPSRYLTLQETE